MKLSHNLEKKFPESLMYSIKKYNIEIFEVIDLNKSIHVYIFNNSKELETIGDLIQKIKEEVKKNSKGPIRFMEYSKYEMDQFPDLFVEYKNICSLNESLQETNSSKKRENILYYLAILIFFLFMILSVFKD
ncbi:hypothetical protein [Sphingobacterium sp.]|uniref:hypothetical protein n=1 Tax=Sphingobacterium sp. TaxID=341027 RepID=UPI0028A728EB|nr:hypothetical protein [Sphingobacterium sp.]